MRKGTQQKYSPQKIPELKIGRTANPQITPRNLRRALEEILREDKSELVGEEVVNTQMPYRAQTIDPDTVSQGSYLDNPMRQIATGRTVRGTTRYIRH